MSKRIVILFLLAFIIAGCIKEDLDNCEAKLRIQFRYTYNNQRKDLLVEQVGDIRIYLFDQSTGLLNSIIRAGKQEIEQGWMETEVPEGLYTAVAWGTSGVDVLQGGYVEAEMVDPGKHTFESRVRIGETIIGDFRMILATDLLLGGTTEDVAPQVKQFDHLFYAMETGVEVIKGKNRRVDLDFIKNTSTLKIQITGIEHLSTIEHPDNEQPLKVFTLGKNERYNYGNYIGYNSRIVRYDPFQTSCTATTMDVHIRIQRLDIDYHTVHPVLLHIQNPVTGSDIIPPLDVIDAILQARDGQGNLVWPTQEAIDREDEFPIEVSILSDLSIKISVNGFEIVDAIAEI